MKASPKKLIELHGATLTRVEPADALNWIQWVCGEGSLPATAPFARAAETLVWLLVHCVDGVTWGRRESETGTWQLGSTVFADLCPTISPNNLLELRLFGRSGELLLWRDDSDGRPEFRGRWLVDNEGFESTNPRRPHPEDRILLGNQHPETKAGFTRIGDGTGREQAVPLTCHAADFGTNTAPQSPLRLSVRHYFTTDGETGAVRVTASRLVNVFNAVSQGVHS